VRFSQEDGSGVGFFPVDQNLTAYPFPHGDHVLLQVDKSPVPTLDSLVTLESASFPLINGSLFFSPSFRPDSPSDSFKRV